MKFAHGLWVGALLAAVACGERGGAEPADPKAIAAVTKQAEGLKTEESTVLSRRDELQRERKKISADRAALVEKRRQVAAQGGSVAEVEAQETALIDREQQLVDQESELNRRFEGLFKKYEELAVAAPVASGGPSSPIEVARREGALAIREKDV